MAPKIKKSLELLKRAEELIPLCSQTASKSINQYIRGFSPAYLESGNGCMVTDVDGNEYIDTVCALGPIILGYNNQRTIDAVTKQLKKGTTFSLPHSLEVELAELLVDIIPCAEQVRYAKNGTDVTLAAVRLARSYTGKEHILKPYAHYHGFGSWNAASTDRDFGVPGCLKELIDTFPYNDLYTLEKKLSTGKFAGLIMEPTQQETPKEGFLEGVRNLCTKYGTILIFDEMITGFRWSLGGAQEYFGVTPDIATFGKAMGNGMPVSTIVGKKEYMNELNKIFFSMTFGGEACSLAAAIETIKELKENRTEIYDHIWKYGKQLQGAFNDYAELLEIDATMSGQAPWHNMTFNMPDGEGCGDLFRQEMVRNGVLMGRAIVTTWAHKKEHINKIIDAMRRSLGVVKKAMNDNDVDKYLEGERSKAIFSPRNYGSKKG